MSNFLLSVKKALEQDNLNEAIESLNKVLGDNHYSKHYNDVILLKSKIKEYQRDKRNGIIEQSDLDIKKTKLVLSTLELAKEINNELPNKNTANKVDNQPKRPFSNNFGKENVVVQNVNNEGTFTINYDKRKVKVILITIALLLGAAVLIWPKLSQSDKKEKVNLSEQSTLVEEPVILEIKGEYVSAENYSESDFPLDLFKKLNFQSDEYVEVSINMGGDDFQLDVEYERIGNEKVILKFSDGNMTFRIEDSNTLIYNPTSTSSYYYRKK